MPKKKMPMPDNLFDDLLDYDTDGDPIELSDEAKAEIELLERPRKVIDTGKVVAVVLFWTEHHCQCGEWFASPTYPGLNTVMEKREFKSGAAEYIPLQNPQAYPDLPLIVEKRTAQLVCCRKCVESRRAMYHLEAHHVPREEA